MTSLVHSLMICFLLFLNVDGANGNNHLEKNSLPFLHSKHTIIGKTNSHDSILVESDSIRKINGKDNSTNNSGEYSYDEGIIQAENSLEQKSDGGNESVMPSENELVHKSVGVKELIPKGSSMVGSSTHLSLKPESNIAEEGAGFQCVFYREPKMRTHQDEHDFENETFKSCGTKSSCFTFWYEDPQNSSNIVISVQDCWLKTKDCNQTECLSGPEPRHENTFFCCCSADMCNKRFSHSTRPRDAKTAHVPAINYPVTQGPLHDNNYKQKTIIVALVSVLSVALFVVVVFLIYRLCVTPKAVSAPTLDIQQDTDHSSPLLSFDLDDHLKLGEVLVRGRYSEVHKGSLGETEVAVKIYHQHYKQYFQNESNTFQLPFMDHENLVKFYAAKENPQEDSGLTKFLIVLEHASHGSLNSYLKHNTISWTTLTRFSLGIASGLSYLHTDVRKGDKWKPCIAHRDVNTRNILVTSDLNCKLADFGFCVFMQGSKILRNGLLESAEQSSLADVGTLRYLAPEVFDGAVNLRDCEASLKQIDIYALGLVFWEIASRCIDLYQGAPIPEYHLPFQPETGPHPTYDQMQVVVVKRKCRPKFPDVWKDSNSAVRSLKETIEDCWDTDAEARLTALCVHERIIDISSMWIKANRNRCVSSTVNFSETMPINAGKMLVSNGVTYLPSYVEMNNELNEGNERTLFTDVIISPEGHECILPIDSEKDIFGSQTYRNRISKEQSMSDSTMDTLLPISPDDNRDLKQNVSLKTDNVFLAENEAVIKHPNQGRNPTVERNTRKNSDEGLTVMGNRLVGPSDSRPGISSQPDSSSTHSAQVGHSERYDSLDVVEQTSLIQNDGLNQQYFQHTSIPCLQNRVSLDTDAAFTQPKLANRDSINLEAQENNSKSITKTLGKILRTKDLKFKISHALVGLKNRKTTSKVTEDVENGSPLDFATSVSHYENRALERSPISHLPGVSMEVRVVKGETVTRACPNVDLMNSRTSATYPRAPLPNTREDTFSIINPPPCHSQNTTVQKQSNLLHQNMLLETLDLPKHNILQSNDKDLALSKLNHQMTVDKTLSSGMDKKMSKDYCRNFSTHSSHGRINLIESNFENIRSELHKCQIISTCASFDSLNGKIIENTIVFGSNSEKNCNIAQINKEPSKNLQLRNQIRPKKLSLNCRNEKHHDESETSCDAALNWRNMEETDPFVPNSNGSKQCVVSKTENTKISCLSCDKVNSSEKIRKRIKTPVGFEKGRLSLYDDRLMTQSVSNIPTVPVLSDSSKDSTNCVSPVSSPFFQSGMTSNMAKSDPRLFV